MAAASLSAIRHRGRPGCARWSVPSWQAGSSRSLPARLLLSQRAQPLRNRELHCRRRLRRCPMRQVQPSPPAPRRYGPRRGRSRSHCHSPGRCQWSRDMKHRPHTRRRTNRVWLISSAMPSPMPLPLPLPLASQRGRVRPACQAAVAMCRSLGTRPLRHLPMCLSQTFPLYLPPKWPESRGPCRARPERIPGHICHWWRNL